MCEKIMHLARMVHKKKSELGLIDVWVYACVSLPCVICLINDAWKSKVGIDFLCVYLKAVDQCPKSNTVIRFMISPIVKSTSSHDHLDKAFFLLSCSMFDHEHCRSPYRTVTMLWVIKNTFVPDTTWNVSCDDSLCLVWMNTPQIIVRTIFWPFPLFLHCRRANYIYIVSVCGGGVGWVCVCVCILMIDCCCYCSVLQSVYIIIQKRFIFNQPNCTFSYISQYTKFSYLIPSIFSTLPRIVDVVPGVWRSHPIYVTAYSYLFGVLFMGLTSLYYVASGQYSYFHVEEEVSKMVQLASPYVTQLHSS